MAHGQLAEVIFDLILVGSLSGGYSGIAGVTLDDNIDVFYFPNILRGDFWSAAMHGHNVMFLALTSIALGGISE